MHTFEAAIPGKPESGACRTRSIGLQVVFRTGRLVYGPKPVHVLEVLRMSSFKYRAYPVMIAAISILAATGGVWRTT